MHDDIVSEPGFLLGGGGIRPPLNLYCPPLNDTQEVLCMQSYSCLPLYLAALRFHSTPPPPPPPPPTIF